MVDFSEDFHDAERPGLDVTSLAPEAAKKISRNCRHCAGSAFATVYDPEFRGSAVIDYAAPDGAYRNRLGRTVAYCVCAYGRWVMVNHSKHAKDVYDRIQDFSDVLAGHSFWLADDPSEFKHSDEDLDAMDGMNPGQLLRRLCPRDEREITPTPAEPDREDGVSDKPYTNRPAGWEIDAERDRAIAAQKPFDLEPVKPLPGQRELFGPQEAFVLTGKPKPKRRRK